MTVTGDYHTHSTYSRNNHGKNTIKEMVDFAKDLGLKSIAITDHGPGHMIFGIKRKFLNQAREEAKALDGQGIKVLWGLETNLVKRDGSIDLTDEEVKNLDILLVGYHKGTVTNFFSHFRNFFNKRKQRQINTEAYLNLLNKYKVDIITHLNEYIRVDVGAVARAAAKKGTLIELNNKHLKFNDDEAKQLIESGCKFILSSDAHMKENIANVDNALAFVKKYGIDPERIVNLDKLYI